MGNKNKFTRKNEQITPYERERMKILEANAATMKAKGFNKSLVNKVLQEKYERVSKDIVDDICISNEVMDCQPEDPLNLKCSKGKKEKKSLSQTLPMLDFLKVRVQERKLKSTQEKPKENEQSKHVQENQQTHLVQEHQQPQLAQQHQENQQTIQLIALQKENQQTSDQQQSQRMRNQQPLKSMDPQKNRKVYCAPGSVSRYAEMVRIRGLRGEGTSDTCLMQQLDDDAPLSDEIDVSENVENSQDNEENASNQFDGNETTVTQLKKHRGRTILANIHGRRLDERDEVILDHMKQPVGRTKEIVQKFTRFLGTLARDSNFAPLNIISWKYMPTTEKIWEYVQKKFDIDKEGKQYVLASVNSKWRVYKARLKKEFYSPDLTIEKMMANRPTHIPENEFKELLEFWDSQEAKEISKTNKENRAKQIDMHTMGPTSFSILHQEMKENDPNKKSPLKADLYRESRKRTVGRRYLTPNEETLQNIEKMNSLKSNHEESTEYDPYYDVITKKEHNGRLRMHGLGVTKSNLKKRNPNAPYVLPPMFLEGITQQFENMVQEAEKRQEERFEQKFADFLSKIREANPGVDINVPNIPMHNEGSPGINEE